MSTIERRQLLRKLWSDAAERAAPATTQDLPPRRRPPGALREAEFLAACTRCGKCGEACPERAVFTFAPSAGALAGTPVLLPDERACAMCDGFPCTAACPDGALLPFEGPAWSLGRVVVQPEHCLAHRGPECGACAGLCPGSLRALRLQAGKPVVDAASCIGCGLCIAACPTTPKALALDPLPPPHGRIAPKKAPVTA